MSTLYADCQRDKRTQPRPQQGLRSAEPTVRDRAVSYVIDRADTTVYTALGFFIIVFTRLLGD